MRRRLVLVVGLLVGACSEKPRPTMEEIAAACDRQFGAGTEASAHCQLEIVVGEAQQDHARRQKAAAAEVR